MSIDLIVNLPFASRHPDLWRLITEKYPAEPSRSAGAPGLPQN
jgi:hypothetical protein